MAQKSHNRKQTLVTFLIFVIAITPLVVLGATSTNFQLNQEGTGFTEFSASSTNYQFRAVIGEPPAQISTSTNYIIDQGKTWTSGDPTVTILFAVPQLRAGTSSTNDDAGFFITIRTSTNADDVILFTSGLATTTTAGAYTTQIELTDIAPGTYDIGFKGNQHITKVLQDVTITTGNTQLNFSSTGYATTTKGSVVLLAGDVSGAGSSAATLGDDVVNSIDLSILLPELDKDDSTGNGIRSNFNQDVVVNSVDLSIMLDNLDKEGDN